jgi:hypothetical protein
MLIAALWSYSMTFQSARCVWENFQDGELLMDRLAASHPMIGMRAFGNPLSGSMFPNEAANPMDPNKLVAV